MDVRVRMGDAIDPFQLANGFEAAPEILEKNIYYNCPNWCEKK